MLAGARPAEAFHAPHAAPLTRSPEVPAASLPPRQPLLALRQSGVLALRQAPYSQQGKSVRKNTSGRDGVQCRKNELSKGGITLKNTLTGGVQKPHLQATQAAVAVPCDRGAQPAAACQRGAASAAPPCAAVAPYAAQADQGVLGHLPSGHRGAAPGRVLHPAASVGGRPTGRSGDGPLDLLQHKEHDCVPAAQTRGER